MANTQPGKMEAACQQIYGEDAETCVPRLMEEYRAPHKVAARLDVVPNTVRVWLLQRGWHFDGEGWSRQTEESLV